MGATARVVRKRNRKLPVAVVGHTKAKVGFPGSKTSQDIVNRAAWNNFGTINIPERPFMSNAFEDNRSKYVEALRVSAPKVLRGDVEIGQVTSKLGIVFSDDIREEIVNLDSPANALSTIKKKGSSNPLIDSGEMKNSVTYQTYD